MYMYGSSLLSSKSFVFKVNIVFLLEYTYIMCFLEEKIKIKHGKPESQEMKGFREEAEERAQGK